MLPSARIRGPIIHPAQPKCNISAAARKRLTAQYESLNVAQLRRQIEGLRNPLFTQLEKKNCAEPSTRKRHGPGIRIGGAANAIWMRKMMNGENQ